MSLPTMPGTHTWVQGGPMLARAGQGQGPWISGKDGDAVYVWDENTGLQITDLRDALSNTVSTVPIVGGWVDGVGVPVASTLVSFSVGLTGKRFPALPVQTIMSALTAGAANDSAVATLLGNPASSTRTASDGLYPRKDSAPKSLADYGVLPGNTATQNRTGFASAQASGYVDWVLPAGTYQYAAASEGTFAMTFTNKNRIRIRGINAVINDTSTFTNNGALTGLFLLDGCKDVEITGVEYVGPVLGSPTTLLGYQGATVVRAINATDGVKVDLRITNARYGLQTGEYGDGTKGQCKNFDVKVRGTKVGYSLAAYYADGIRHDLDVDGVHRIAYIAGCNDVKGFARFRNQYIADTAYLITDTLITGSDATAEVAPPANPTTSRGCTNIDVDVADTGSTTFQPSSMAAGISLSRVDACAFKNIRVDVYVPPSSNTVCTTMGGWRIISGAKSIWPRYPFNFESTIVFEDVAITVNMDHSGQSVTGSTGSEIYMLMYDTSSSHAATVRNLRLSGSVKKSPAETRSDYYHAPGLVTGGDIALSHDGTFAVFTNSTTSVKLAGKYNQVDITGVTGGSPLNVSNAVITKLISAASITNTTTDSGSLFGGAGPIRKVTENTLTLSGASTSWTGAIPQGAVVVGVQTRVQTAITGATSGYQVGVAGTTNRYGDFIAMTVGTTSGVRSYLAAETAPRNYTAATDLVITANGGSFTAGAVRIILTYDTFPNPTS